MRALPWVSVLWCSAARQPRRCPCLIAPHCQGLSPVLPLLREQVGSSRLRLFLDQDTSGLREQTTGIRYPVFIGQILEHAMEERMPVWCLEAT